MEALRWLGVSKTMAQHQNRPEPRADHYRAQWREYLGYTQEGLADMAGVSHSTISRLESGQTSLKTPFLKRLARIFRIPASALLDVNPLGDGRQTAEMLRVWAEIPEQDREVALKMLRGLQEQKSS